jgi:integrase/recombinase XerD
MISAARDRRRPQDPDRQSHFRATGITAYLKNNGTLEAAQQIANHESPRTTKLYDRRDEEISLDEVEKISI